MTKEECIKSLYLLLECVDDKLQGERDKMTKLIDIKPTSFEFVLLETIELLERQAQERGHWIDRDILMKKICENECGSIYDEKCENAMCNFYDYIMNSPTMKGV